ncbi:hypothetical protein KKB40_05970 [Patescibacteria group bacterium]|nr:hypothetical protein [Patescibacteria group bacterium]
MVVESNQDKPTLQDVELLEEARLRDLATRIGSVGKDLMNTFFPDDTWDFRQCVAYGFPILGAEEDENYDPERDQQLVSSIYADLDDRLSYYNEAYRFSDVLFAIKVGCSHDWLEMVAEDEGKPKDEVANRIVAETQKRLVEETQRLEDFLGSDIFRRAFSLQIDRQTGDYSIRDLNLDPSKIRDRWKRLFIESPDEVE